MTPVYIQSVYCTQVNNIAHQNITKEKKKPTTLCRNSVAFICCAQNHNSPPNSASYISLPMRHRSSCLFDARGLFSVAARLNPKCSSSSGRLQSVLKKRCCLGLKFRQFCVSSLGVQVFPGLCRDSGVTGQGLGRGIC